MRDPNSRRGRAEAAQLQKLAGLAVSAQQARTAAGNSADSTPSEIPAAPTSLTRQQVELFQKLVVDLLAARVPLRQIDATAIAMAVRTVSAAEEAERISVSGKATVQERLAALKLLQAFQRDLKDWLQIICATPGSRARIGLKPPAEKKPPGAIGRLIAERQAR